MIDRSFFFTTVRGPLFGGKLSTDQATGLLNIIEEWEHRQLSDLRWLAYMLATTYHETAFTIQPIRERGSDAYLRSKPYYPWVGEGLVQVTWEGNARKFGATAPGQLLTWPICLKPLFDGMMQGMFTGKKLSNYFNGTTEDPVNARRIINGTDKASEIAGYYHLFNVALRNVVVPVVAPAALPSVQPPPIKIIPLAPAVLPPAPAPWKGLTMNSNLIRTILNLLSGGAFTSILTNVLSCSGDTLGAATCSAAFIPLKYQAIAGAAFVAIGFLLKIFGGSGATATQNLVAPVVPVVAPEAAKAGVVTAAQVSNPSAVK